MKLHSGQDVGSYAVAALSSTSVNLALYRLTSCLWCPNFLFILHKDSINRTLQTQFNWPCLYTHSFALSTMHIPISLRTWIFCVTRHVCKCRGWWLRSLFRVGFREHMTGLSLFANCSAQGPHVVNVNPAPAPTRPPPVG